MAACNTTTRNTKSVPYTVGYGKPPLHTQFRKGQSGNPGGRPRRTVPESAKALALQEAYRTVTVDEDGKALALPAIQAILRSQVALAAKGNVQAQLAVVAAIQKIEQENAKVAEEAVREVSFRLALAQARGTTQERRDENGTSGGQPKSPFDS